MKREMESLSRVDHSIETQGEFVNLYLREVEARKGSFPESPLVAHVRQFNRYSPLNMNVYDSLSAGKFKSVFDSLRLEGQVCEAVSSTLDRRDDYTNYVYHWRKGTFQERTKRVLDSLRFKLETRKAKNLKAVNLAGFYLTTAINIYNNESSFMEMAAADVFHTRGERYAKDVIRFAWEDLAEQKGYGIDSGFYPDGHFVFKPEYEDFTNPIFDSLLWLNKVASDSWFQMREGVALARDKWISGIVAVDRLEYFNDWCGKEGIKTGNLEKSARTLSKVGIKILNT